MPDPALVLRGGQKGCLAELPGDGFLVGNGDWGGIRLYQAVISQQAIAFVFPRP